MEVRRNSLATLHYADVDQAYLDKHFPGISLPEANHIINHEGYQKRIDENPTIYSTKNLSNRIPCPITVDENGEIVERDKDRIARINETLRLRKLQTVEDEKRPRPKITDSVPETLPITRVNQLRDHHIVYYSNVNGSIYAVVDVSDRDAVTFYDRYYISPATPSMRKTSGDRIRKMVANKDCYIIVDINNQPIQWGTKQHLREWMAKPREFRAPIKRGMTLHRSEPTFVERAFNRPAFLDLPRVAFILSMYSRVKA
jgi:hypothetical protein